MVRGQSGHQLTIQWIISTSKNGTKLKKVIITNDLIAEIEKGMTDSSNWLHDAAPGLDPTPPDTTRAEADLKFFEDFAFKCGAA